LFCGDSSWPATVRIPHRILSMKSIIVSIHIAGSAMEPMSSIGDIQAIAGRGLEGDRYFHGTGTYSNEPGSGREITLIEIEAIEALSRDYRTELDPAQTRRNLVTRGIALNHLVGHEFNVGDVLLRGTRLCEPCSHLEKLTTRGVARGLIHRGGLRAEIVSGGWIRVGAEIWPKGK
jgi:MOSC domain-containing protein YiiM